jgi:acetate kinase
MCARCARGAGKAFVTGAILTLNAGSSSIKFALYQAAHLEAMLRGEIETLGGAPHLWARDPGGAVLAERRWAADGTGTFDATLHALLDFVDSHLGDATLSAVGHRVVHGGADHAMPELVTPGLLVALEALTALDPLHMPVNLAPIRAISLARPALPQVVCFDTGFHHDMPALAQLVALPQEVVGHTIRRYGFHGLSYEFIAGRLAQIAPARAKGRVIVAHLGSGASLCALLDGRSIETTTGFSALDGLVMATRCGTIDPGVLLYLSQQGHSVGDIEDMLYRRSGLLGVSGISGDVRVLEASTDKRARLALGLFSYRIAGEAGRLVAALGGLDMLVFTAGVGEHAASVRADVCARLGWLGVTLDPAANAASANVISTPGATVETRVVPTDEEAVIARHTSRVAGIGMPLENSK